MEGFVKGEIVVLPFPFSNLKDSVKRPALIISKLKGDDLILCQITGESRLDDYFVNLEKENFEKGHLNVKSVIRPNKLFTADKSIIKYKIGSLKQPKINEVEDKLIGIIRN